MSRMAFRPKRWESGLHQLHDAADRLFGIGRGDK